MNLPKEWEAIASDYCSDLSRTIVERCYALHCEAQAERIAELEAERDALKAEAARLVGRLDSEVSNLCEKIGRKEDEGWEGSKRRHALHSDAKRFIDAAIKEQA